MEIPKHLNIYLSTKFKKLCDECLTAQIIKIEEIEEKEENDEFDTSLKKKKKKTIKKINLNKIFNTEIEKYTDLINSIITNLKITLNSESKKNKKDKKVTDEERLKIIITYLIKKFINPPIKQNVFIGEDVKKYVELFIKSSLNYFNNNINIFLDKTCLDLILGLINEFCYNLIDKTYPDYKQINQINFVNSQIFESLVVFADENYIKIHLPAAGDIFDIKTNNLFDVKLPLYKCVLPSKEFKSKGAHGGKYIWKNRQTINGYFFKYNMDNDRIIIKYTNGITINEDIKSAKVFNMNEIPKCVITQLLKKFIDYLSQLKTLLDSDLNELKEYVEFIDKIITGLFGQLTIDKFVDRFFRYINNKNMCDGIIMNGFEPFKIEELPELQWNDSTDSTDKTKQKYLKYKQKYLQLKKLMQERIEHL